MDRLLLPHPLQRELPDAGPARWRDATRTSSSGLYRWAAAPEGLDAARRRSCSRARRRARPARPQAALAEHYDVGAELWSATSYKRAARGRPRRRAPQPAAPRADDRRARRTVTEQLATSAGPDRRRHRLHEGRARPDRPLRAGRAHLRPRSGPTASGAPTPARRCAASSRPTPPTSWSPRWPPWPTPERSTAPPSPRPSSATTSTPTRRIPALGSAWPGRSSRGENGIMLSMSLML